MSNKLSRLLAAIACALPMAQAVAAQAAPEPAPAYRQGAFYYGSDCGGNSAMDARAARKPATPGLILDGAAQSHITGYMNCDDRRTAFSVYRDGLEGKLGQSYAWRNTNGGGFGSMTPLRQFMRGAFACRDFREENLVGLKLVPRTGTACRQDDGNWHTL